MRIQHSTSGFTLVEMVLACTIFAIMSLAVISVYIQTTSLTSKLKATRYLSETSREITEKIAEDIRTKGLSWTIIATSSHPYWNGTSNYTTNGTEILGIGNGTRFYLYGKKDDTPPYAISPCTGSIKTDRSIHCGLYLIKDSASPTAYSDAENLIDSFIPEEKKKRVKVEDMKFYISWDGITTERKATLVFSLALMPRIGVPNMTASESKIRIQTTISERFFKN